MAADQQRAGLQLPALTGSRRLRSARFTKKQKHTSIANARHWYASILIFSRKKNKLNEGEPSSFDGEEPCAHLSQNHIKWHSFKVLCCVQAVHPLYLCDRNQLRSPHFAYSVGASSIATSVDGSAAMVSVDADEGRNSPGLQYFSILCVIFGNNCISPKFSVK